MKPAPFDYEAPDSLAATLDLLEQHGDEAKLLAGGQSLIPVMNFRLAQPALLIDLNRVPGLDALEASGSGGLRIGAMTRHASVERSDLVGRNSPLLAEAMPLIAHSQIRNRGTVGGSLAHADPSAELPAVMTALGARFKLVRRGGERWVAAKDFYQGLFATSLEPEEILTEIDVPAGTPGTGTAFLEIARRHGDYALVGLAATVTLDAAGRCSRCRLVYLSVGDQPVDAVRAAALIEGESPTAEAIAAAADLASREEMDPMGDLHGSPDFKRHLAGVLTRRALEKALDRAREAAS